MMRNEIPFTGASAWIWMADAPDANCYAQFRKTFSVETVTETALHLSVDGNYAAFVNGVALQSSQYPDYPYHKAVQDVDITACLKQGENQLEIQAWYLGQDGACSRRDDPGLRFEVFTEEKMLCVSDAECEVRPLPGYVQGEIEDITPQLRASFCMEKKVELPWQKAVLAEKQADCVMRPIKELVVQAPIQPAVHSQGIFRLQGGDNPATRQQYAGLYYREFPDIVTKCAPIVPRVTPASSGVWGVLPSKEGLHLKSDEQADGIYLVLDLGKNCSGNLCLDVTTPEEAKVEVGFGEHLNDMRVRTYVGSRNFAVSVYTSPKRDRFYHPFRRIGCRYLQLFIYAKEATVYEASVCQVDYPVDETVKFSCSDNLHERIYDVAKHTLRQCLHDHYEDCPWREQALYAFDSRNQMLAGYYAFGEFNFVKESLRTLALSQGENGLLELTAPAKIWVNIPMFSLIFPVQLEEYCLYSGDLDFGREMRPYCMRILEGALKHFDGQVCHNYTEVSMWNFYEWTERLDGEPFGADIAPKPGVEGLLQLFLILAVQRMQALDEMLGITDTDWQTKLTAMQAGMEHFWNEEKQAYCAYLVDGKQEHYAELTQAMALYTGSVPAGRAEKLRAGLLDNDWVTLTISHSIFKYEALLQEPEKYGEIVFKEIARRWGEMLYAGATTFWETENGANCSDRGWSLCHAWNGTPIYFYNHYVLGVQPVKPGVWRCQKPTPAGIYTMESELVTPEGRMKVSRKACEPGDAKLEFMK